MGEISPISARLKRCSRTKHPLEMAITYKDVQCGRSHRPELMEYFVCPRYYHVKQSSKFWRTHLRRNNLCQPWYYFQGKAVLRPPAEYLLYFHLAILVYFVILNIFQLANLLFRPLWCFKIQREDMAIKMEMTGLGIIDLGMKFMRVETT